MKYLGQMKNQSKKLSEGPFECFCSRLRASLSTSKRRLSSTEKGWKRIVIHLVNFYLM